MTEDFRIRPFSPWLWLALPGALLLWITLFPPHGLDLALSRLFYAPGEGFELNRAPAMLFLHRIMRIAPFACGFAALLLAFRSLRRGGFRKKAWLSPDVRRAACLIAGMLLSVTLVKLLKSTTGVYCPVSVTAFGGGAPLLGPSWSWVDRPGHCWPSGFAGTGFCLFALYFALRDASPRLGRLGLLAAFEIGGFCGVVQVMRGEHFLSHVLGTCLIDWLACLAVYLIVFAPEAAALIRQGWRRRSCAGRALRPQPRA